MLYSNISLKKDKKTSSAIVGDDGKLLNVYIDERLSEAKGYNKFPYFSLELTRNVIDKDISFNNVAYECMYRLSTFFPNANLYNYKIEKKYILKCYESFYTSGFDRSAILVINGLNDYDINEPNIILIHKFKKETYILNEFDIECKLIKFYNDAINVLGFNNNDDLFVEYASNGQPLEKKYIEFVNDSIKVNYDFNKLKEDFGINYNSINTIDSYNFAATIQKNLNDCVLELVKHIRKLTGEDRICLAGGLFNNISINNAICESNIFSHIHCFPIPGEYSGSIGEAYFLYEKLSSNYQNLHLDSDSIGMFYSDQDVLKFLKNYSIDYKILNDDDLLKLFSNDLIMWFQGGANIGECSSIHRCILCNPKLFLDKNNNNDFDINIKTDIDLIKKINSSKLISCMITNDNFDNVFYAINKDLIKYGLRFINVKKEFLPNMCNIMSQNGKSKVCLIDDSLEHELYNLLTKLQNKFNISYLGYVPLYNKNNVRIESLTQCLKYFLSNNNINYLILNGKYIVDKEKKYNIYFDEFYEYNKY